MTLRIGIDFDNTIACYDAAFRECAKTLNYIPAQQATSKQEIKKAILELPDGDIKWQRVQGLVYGKYISYATLFPGLAEFLWRCRVAGAEVFIVSHKTDFGHFDEEKVNLRDAARDWMMRRDFFLESKFAISSRNLFFEYTREEKVKKISTLKLDFFIDDLTEVLTESAFPLQTKKILFAPTHSEGVNLLAGIDVCESWQQITSVVLGPVTEQQTLNICQTLWPALGLSQIHAIRGRGNSRVFQLVAGEKSYALKQYPNLQLDSRPRLETEFKTCALLHGRGLPVAKSVAKDLELNWGLYEWLDGVDIGKQRRHLIPQVADFIGALTLLGPQIEYGDFPAASEACFSGVEIERQISRRISALKNVGNIELNGFLENALLPVYNVALTRAKLSLGASFDQDVAQSERVLSPSDFGFHNMKVSNAQKLVFYDFEYFGWDDPIKLISDSLWHPGMNLDENESLDWLNAIRLCYRSRPHFDLRFKNLFPLFGIRWALILLNEFVLVKMKNRINAEPERQFAIEAIQSQQLEKAEFLLNRIQKYRIINLE